MHTHSLFRIYEVLERFLKWAGTDTLFYIFKKTTKEITSCFSRTKCMQCLRHHIVMIYIIAYYSVHADILFWGCTFGGVYIPCIYSHARWSYRRRFRWLLLCPLSVDRCYFFFFFFACLLIRCCWFVQHSKSSKSAAVFAVPYSRAWGLPA